ncbi:MAG: hypothetical protein LLG93_07700 [Deltaproteobacteria bacterium]|nr:hypothetical protein [Deltaproteobacteria bacterium]
MCKNKQGIIVFLLIIMTVFFLWGCAEKSKELLVEDYKRMNNEELLRYFYRLNDEIELQEKQQHPQFGFGVGSFGSSGGVGVGVDSGGSGYTAEDLRTRRIDIRMELKNRGLNP